MDEGGWNVVKPFLAETYVPYRMLLGDDAIAQRYGIENLPDTFLIDRHGRVAAAYVAGWWNQENVEANGLWQPDVRTIRHPIRGKAASARRALVAGQTLMQL